MFNIHISTTGPYTPASPVVPANSIHGAEIGKEKTQQTRTAESEGAIMPGLQVGNRSIW